MSSPFRQTLAYSWTVLALVGALTLDGVIWTTTPQVASETSAPPTTDSAIAGSVGAAAGTTWYVTPSGNDASDCLGTGTACQTIDGAIGKATAGDTVLVASGTYTGMGDTVVTIPIDLSLSGGWNLAFTTQAGTSWIDGESTRRGIAVTPGNSVAIEGFTIINGEGFPGGGLDIEDSTVTLDRVDLIDANGPGLDLHGSTITVSNSSISGVTGEYAIRSFCTDLTLVSVVIEESADGIEAFCLNNAETNAVLVDSSTISTDGFGLSYDTVGGPGTAEIVDSLFDRNATGISNRGTMDIDRSTVSNSRFGGIGNSSVMTIENSTISGNNWHANAGEGGGISNGGVLTVNNTTITDNHVPEYRGGAGIATDPSATTTLSNSIVAGNHRISLSWAPDCSGGGTYISRGHNLIGDLFGCSFTPKATDITNVDARLSELANFGGPTPTHAPLAGSPTLEAGSPLLPGSSASACAPTDQRGVGRPQGDVCDIGALEAEGVTGTVSGKVVDEFGQPVSMGNIELWSEFGFLGQYPTDGDGSYETGNLYEGVDYFIFFWNGDESTFIGWFPEWYPNRPHLRPDLARPLRLGPGQSLTGIDAHLEPLFDDMFDTVFTNDIGWLRGTGITKGCSTYLFCTGDPVDRGAMAAFLTRGLQLTDDGGGDLFIDDDTSIFEQDIDRLATAGVTRGCNPPENDRFCPNGVVDRGAMAAFLVRAMGYKDDGGGDLFVDDDGSIFEHDIDRLAAAGVTRGCNPPVNDMFCPRNPVTRGAMAAFLHRALGGGVIYPASFGSARPEPRVFEQR